jgi:hypothetical protein
MLALHNHTHCQAPKLVPVHREAHAKAKACQRVCLSQRMADSNEVAN